MSLSVIKELQQTGSVQSSRMGKVLRKEMAGLFTGRVLVERRSTTGRRVHVESPEILSRWIEQTHPHGLDQKPMIGSRLDAIMHLGDSHRVTVGSPMVLLRALYDIEIVDPDGIKVNVRQRSEDVGSIGLNLASTKYRTAAPIVLIENKELYEDDHAIKALGYGEHLIAWSSGTPSDVLLGWLHDSDSPKIVHLPDYDGAGLRDNLRLKEKIGERARLHVPEDLENLVMRYGSRRTAIDLAKERKLLSTQDEQVRGVLEILVRHGKGLEQELLRRTTGE